MKAKVIKYSNTSADVFMSDGGVATLHHNGGHIITTYYQSRIPLGLEERDYEKVWEKLSEGKAYIKDWEGQHKINDDMVQDALHWLAPGELNIEIIKTIKWQM